MKIEAYSSVSSIQPSQVGMEDTSETHAEENRSSYDTLQISEEEEGTGCCSWLTDTLYCCFIAPLLSCWNCMSSCVSWFFTSNYLTLENFEEIANKLNNTQNGIDEKTFLELLDWAFDNPQAFNQVYQQIQDLQRGASERFISAFQRFVLSKAGFKSPEDPVLKEINNTRLEPLLKTALILSTSFSNNDFPEVLKPLIPKMKDFIAKNTKGTLIEQYEMLPLYFKHLLQKDPTSFFMQFFKEWLANASSYSNYICKWFHAIQRQVKSRSILSLKRYILEDLDEDHLIVQILNNNAIIETLKETNHGKGWLNPITSQKAASDIFGIILNIFSKTEYAPILQQILLKIEDEHDRRFANKFQLALQLIALYLV